MTHSNPAAVADTGADTAYEALVEEALSQLSSAESSDILEPVGNGDEGPLMAWFVAT